MTDQITRGKNEKCMICLKKFTLFNPEHICKRCLRSVCKDCANVKAAIFERGGERKPHRLCSKCMPEAEFLTNYKAAYNITFATNCKIGGSWADQLHKLAVGKNSDLPKIKKPALRNKTDFWESLNFSLRNFFGLCTENIDYYPQLKHLYEKCQLRCSEYVCMFFLCHLNEAKSLESVYAIHGLVNQQPPELDNVMANFKYFGCASKQIAALKPFTESIFPKFVEHVSLNVLTSEISLYILADIIKERSAKVLERGLSASIFAIKDFVVRYGESNKKATENELVLNVRFNQFETNIKILTQKERLEAETIMVRNSSVVSMNTLGQKQADDVANVMAEFAEEDNTGRTQSMVKSQSPSRQNSLNGSPNPKPTTEQTTEQSKPTIDVHLQHDNSSQLSDQISQDPMELSGGSALRKLSVEDEDFDDDLRKLYDQNERMLQQAKTLKKLSEQLLKQIQEL